MYATGDENCPVQALKLLISKTHKDATSLFNNCFREALTCPNTVSVWYDTKGLAKRTFSNFMADICKSSKLSKSYTPHCLRATAIQAMNDRGFSSTDQDTLCLCLGIVVRHPLNHTLEIRAHSKKKHSAPPFPKSLNPTVHRSPLIYTAVGLFGALKQNVYFCVNTSCRSKQEKT